MAIAATTAEVVMTLCWQWMKNRHQGRSALKAGWVFPFHLKCDISANLILADTLWPYNADGIFLRETAF